MSSLPLANGVTAVVTPAAAGGLKITILAGHCPVLDAFGRRQLAAVIELVVTRTLSAEGLL